jgi:hypothetical protein
MVKTTPETHSVKFLFVVAEISLYKSHEPKRIDLGILKNMIWNVSRLPYLPSTPILALV